jgi:hypothetical protein
LKFRESGNKDSEAVVMPLPVFDAHTGQIIMLTKMLTSSDLRFYDFSAGEPRERWQSPAVKRPS